MLSTADAAQRVIAMIGSDVAAGIMPWDVPDFSALHDFVDANTYLDDVLADAGWDFNPSDDQQCRWAGTVIDLVNTALNGGGRRNRWEYDPAGYKTWLLASKEDLASSRAKAFGLTPAQMAHHDQIHAW